MFKQTLQPISHLHHQPPPGLCPTHQLQTPQSTAELELMFLGCSDVTLTDDTRLAGSVTPKNQEIPILTGKLWTRFHSPTAPGQQTYSWLFTAVRKTHRFFPCIVLGCPCSETGPLPLTRHRVDKNCQHKPPSQITCPGGSFVNLQLHEEKKERSWQKHNFNFFLTLRKKLLPSSHMWCNLLFMHTHTHSLLTIKWPSHFLCPPLLRLMPLTPLSFHCWPQDSTKQGKQAVSGYHCNANVSVQIQSNKELFWALQQILIIVFLTCTHKG